MFLFRSGIDGAAFGSLAFIGVGSILTLLYTMRAFQRIWWQDPPEGAKAKPVGDLLVAPFILIGLVLVLGLWAEPLVQVATDTSAWLGNPAGYIQAVMGG
jgi:multicomponent Na+:H+ antiporter subunit D